MTDTFTIDPSWPSIVELAIERWGQPTSRHPNELRFGVNGSKHVNTRDNTWKDFESGDGGGYVDMHHATRGPLPASKSKKPPKRRAQPFQPPIEPQRQNDQPLYDWFDKRHIGTRTVMDFGVYACNADPGGFPAMAFRYVYRDQLHSMKYRSFTTPKRITQRCTGDKVLFNADVVDDAETLYWVEGEIDVMTLHECGFRNVVSLRDGAGDLSSLALHEEELLKVRHHVLAGDMDEPGLRWREQLARRFGYHKCSFVTWPDGYKDANEVLVGAETHGDAVKDALENAEPYPIKGVYPLKPHEVEEWFHEPEPETMTTGVPAVDAILSLPTDGKLIAITGFANHGKSSWLRHVAVHTATHHDRRWLVFSPEHKIRETMILHGQIYIGKKFKLMDFAERNRMSAWLTDHIYPMMCDRRNDAPTVDWLMQAATGSIMRFGITDFAIDPWNEVEYEANKDLPEYRYIASCLGRLAAFGEDHRANIWISAHPTKALAVMKDRDRMINGYDVSGTSGFADKPDLGVTVEKMENRHAKIGIWKTRDAPAWGHTGQTATMWFDDSCGRYEDPRILNEPPPEQPKPQRKARSNRGPDPYWTEDNR